jgi:hypothetical protein
LWAREEINREEAWGWGQSHFRVVLFCAYGPRRAREAPDAGGSTMNWGTIKWIINLAADVLDIDAVGHQRSWRRRRNIAAGASGLDPTPATWT